MVEWVTYPVYPAVRLVTLHCHPQSTASTSSPSSPIDVYTWRALVPQGADLVYRLQKLPAQLLPERFVEVLQSENSEGRAAQGRDDWKTAMAKFETCRTMISEDLRKLVLVHVEEQDLGLLLAWADLPLAELYQSLGSSDSVMLEKAMDMRKEVLRCVTWILGSSFWPRGDNPLPTSNGIGSSLGDLLVQVCVTYYYTAQYEWGRAVNNELARTEAVQKFANFVGCGDDEAESQLCLLLGVDYQYLGRFEVGLEWIEEADRNWPQVSPGVDEYRRILRLSKAELLIKVEKFAEAIKTMDELHDTFREHGLGPLRIRLQSACYSQMSKKAACNGNFDQAKDYEGIANFFEREIEEFEDSELEGSKPDGLQFTYGQIPLSHPMLKATPSPLGSSLGLMREGYVLLRNELRKLPVIQFGVLRAHQQRGETAREDRDWEAAIYWYERMRELLKLTARVVEKQTYDWLLSWCDLTLAHFYHYHTRRFEKAHTIWVDLLSSASHQMGSAHEFLLHGYRFNLAAVLFEGFGEVLSQPYHVLDGNSNTSKHHSCFWLYFGHHRAWNYETALHWLRESKRLKEEHIGLGSTVDCPEMTCSDDDYFCCDYDYLRCEADLLMKLQKFEEAITVLEKLLRTRHIQQGSRLLARQAREWLNRCRDSMEIWAESITNRMKAEPFETNSAVDNEHGYGTAEKLPSTFGCIQVGDDEYMLVQSQVGLEHHLHQLPVHLHMALRWHGNRGCSFLKLYQWEAAIFELEWCREILKIIRVQNSEVEQVKACDWLTVWASVPLADIYEFRTNQIKKALDLWVEISRIIDKVYRQYGALLDEEDTAVVTNAFTLLFVGRYHFSVTEYPDVKDEVVRAFGGAVGEDNWVSENILLTELYNSFVVRGNYEVALRFIRQAKQVFDEHFSEQGLHHMDHLFRHVLAESLCLSGVKRSDDAAKVLRKYIVESSYKADKAKKVPENILRTQEEAKHFAQFSDVMNDKLGAFPYIELFKFAQNMRFDSSERFGGRSGIWQLRMKSLEFSKNGELLKAVECYENFCVELIDKTCNEGLEGALDYKLETFDYFCLGNWRAALIYQTVYSCSYEQIKAYRQDVNFLRAVHYYEKAIELSPSFEASPELNSAIAILYETVDENCACYLLNRYYQSLTESQELFYQMHCMRDDLDVLWRQSFRDIHLGIYEGDPLPLQDAINEMQTFLNSDIPVDKYGEKAIIQFTSLLYYRSSNSYTEDWWVGMLESHNILYRRLQNLHYRRARCFACLKGLGEDFQEQIETSKWTAFMYAEAQRAQVMLYQQLVASNKLNSYKRRGHDALNVHTVEDIRKLCATVLKGPSVYVQYSSIQRAHEWFYIYVIDQDGKLSTILCGNYKEGTRKPEHEGGKRSVAVKKPLSLEKRLNNLYWYLERGDFDNYNGDSMMKDLMYLHGILIKPIAHILRKMKPDDNLILCPNELFTKVPFAALRDSESPQKYLIELHTISLVPSLRVLHNCSERLEELKSSYPYTGRAGSIIALGDPNYKCPTCKKKFTRLKGTRDEVEYISTLFGETAVQKLLGQHATREQLQLWAAKASNDSSCFRQAIVHVGAHVTIDGKHSRQIVSLHLTCDDLESSANIGALSLSDDTNASHEENTSQPPGKRHEVESDDNSDEDLIDSDDEEFGLQINMSTSQPFNVQSMSMSKEYTSFQETSQGPSSSRSRAQIGRNAGTTQQSVASHALKVEDLNSFEWRAELVVLSTCLSARGKITAEGVLSLARAFMIVGVPCVVASQWKVDDDTTVALMKVFYEELHRGKNVASALRSSMLAHMRTHRDSVGQWAPFNVWGVSSLCLPEDLLDPHRSRENPMSVSPVQADLAGGEGNELQIPSTDSGRELSSSTKDSIGYATSSGPAPPPQLYYICDGCSSAILTRYWHCNVCPDSFDLCPSCYVGMCVNQYEVPPHSRDHPMTPSLVFRLLSLHNPVGILSPCITNNNGRVGDVSSLSCGGSPCHLALSPSIDCLNVVFTVVSHRCLYMESFGASGNRFGISPTEVVGELLPERFVAVLQSENGEGRAAQERGDWKTAMAKFETCRTMISEDLRKLVPVHVEEQDLGLLLAWADLPLAELYQLLGSDDSFLLELAMDMRKEELRCVTWILGSSFWSRVDNPLEFPQVCVTYYYTTQYARKNVVEWRHFNKIPYQYLRTFEIGLGWIEEADRHWPQISPGVDEIQMSRRAECKGNFDQVKDYKRESELEGSEPDEWQFTFSGQIPLSHPMRKATPSPLGRQRPLLLEAR